MKDRVEIKTAVKCKTLKKLMKLNKSWQKQSAAYLTYSYGYWVLCSNIPFEIAGILRSCKKIGIAFTVDNKSNSAENFLKMGAGKINFF